jgi:maleate isomerase
VTDNNPFEFYLMAPRGVQLHLTSLGIEVPGEAAYEKALDEIEGPIRRLLERNVDLIVQSGVPPIVNRGWGAEDELRARVAQWTSLPFASDIGCSIAAFQALGVHRPAMLTTVTYHPAISRYLAHADIEVVASPDESAFIPPEADRQSPGAAYAGAVALAKSVQEADGVFIPIASRPTVSIIDELEEATGLPVVTSTQAQIWYGLRLGGIDPAEVQGFGRLFQPNVEAIAE